MTTTAGRETAGLHGLLLRLAGRIPDGLLTESRRWLAAGEAAEVRAAVTNALLTGNIPVTVADAERLGGGVPVGGVAPQAHAFSPFGPGVPSDGLPYSLDLTRPWDGPGGLDGLDRAAVAAVEKHAGVRGLWRSWRYPARETRWPPPKRVHLVLVGDDPVAVAAVVQAALAAAGERDPQVEAYGAGDEVSDYQHTALTYSALLWSSAPTEPLRSARLYDRLGPDGRPGFADGHPVLADAMRDRVLDYLNAGVPVLVSPDLTADVVEPGRGAAVPMSFRTDGRWVWAEGSAYYLAEYSLAPEPDLLADIAAAGFRVPEVDDVSLHRVLHHLYAGVR